MSTLMTIAHSWTVKSKLWHYLFKCPTFWSLKQHFHCPVCGASYRCYWDANDIGGLINVCKKCAADYETPGGWAHREHITDGTPCWCNPETTYTAPDTGASVVMHKEAQ